MRIILPISLLISLLITHTIYSMEHPKSILKKNRRVRELREKDGTERPKLFVRFLSTQIFGDETDAFFESMFIEILSENKKPSLYKELYRIRRALIEEYEKYSTK